MLNTSFDSRLLAYDFADVERVVDLLICSGHKRAKVFRKIAWNFTFVASGWNSSLVLFCNTFVQFKWRDH
jgi:hypothetical protein